MGIKYNPNESYEQWVNKVRLQETGEALQRLAKGDINKLSSGGGGGQGYPCHGLVAAGDPDRNAAVAGAAQSDGIRGLKARSNPAVAMPAIGKGNGRLGYGDGDR